METSDLLELHRASAGSGKTYTLARKFLWYFLTIREEDKPRRLRTPAEIADSLSHILAVTFTNKATNEMQQRIVEKLDALASPPPGKSPDYMDDFCRELNVSPAKLSAICRRALARLLENYSEFQVSTIDSFFQLVLRTFAYETDLNDSYTVELDSEYISKMGIDSVLEDIEEGKASEEVKFWIDLLMERVRESGGKWNIFQKRGGGSPYSGLASAIGKLENEDFKQIRDDLEEYLEQTPDLPELYLALEKRYGSIPNEPYAQMCRKAKELLCFVGARTDATLTAITGHARKCLACTVDRVPSGNKETFTEYNKFFGKTYQTRRGADPEFYDGAQRLYEELIAAREVWTAALTSPEYSHWRLYKHNFPYFGLLSVSLRKRRELLEENNAVELGETNAMLSRIIGEDDAPFIYERLGTRLNHFLIDEFQDTSRMQWRNLRPLLAESIGRGNGNLLIGDAKQSIYRFRNADPSLISSVVESDFGGVSTHGDAPGENTNWRSDRNVVEFNNGVFSFMADTIATALADEEGHLDFKALYSNVVQTPHAKPDSGFVDIRMIDGSKGDAEQTILDGCVELVMDFLSRGFRQRDIVFLVDTNDQGEELIERFSRHNAEAGDSAQRIEFISEQSLKVASAPSVALILTALETICRGADPQVRTGDDGHRRGVADWDEVRCNYLVFALRHPSLSAIERLETFLASGADNDAVGEMLNEMQAVSLPALVEGIAATFLPENMRRRDAPFIAAFQDIVLEYCESRPSDIASFLQWWNRRGARAAISSPEGMDAVRVMTIHKAKGLEFPCVVMPFAQYTFLPSSTRKSEWRWVRPELIEAEGYAMPPFLPVDTSREMLDTSHAGVYKEFVDMVTMDCLNKLYVGFTRAVRELYAFLPVGSKPAPLSVSSLVKGYYDSVKGTDAGKALEMSSDGLRLTSGHRYEVSPEKYEGEDSGTFIIPDYTARVTPEFLKYREENVPEVVDAEDFEEGSDNDPRSEGNVLHAVMERIDTVSDLPRALRHIGMQGLISSAAERELGEFLSRRLSDPRVCRWFDGSGKVMNERPLLDSHGGVRRPDRVLCYPDGGAVVIDYKFGAVVESPRYRRQVSGYVNRLRETGKFRYVEGWLWYVREDVVEKVE